MSSCLLINLDEFDTLSPTRMQELKSLITQDVMNERKVYDIQNYTFIRRASFIASTNNPHCLPDIGENRRILFNTLLEIDYHTPVNHQGIYAQAYALYRQGFQYWYENQEITFLNNRNEAFRQKDPVEENLFFYFRAARPNDIQAKWYPASQLLSILSMNRHTGQRTDETNAGHGIGKQPFPLTEDLQQYHGILGGGVFGRRAQRKFNTPAAPGADGVGVVVFPRNGSFHTDSRFSTK